MPVLCRHPGTFRQIAQALGAAGLTSRQALAPGLLPRSQPGEFPFLVIDLDIQADAPPPALVAQAAAACPGAAVVAVAGLATRQRLLEALVLPAVCGVVPKLGTWLEPREGEPPVVSEGPDEQELTTAFRRFLTPSAVPLGPAPYLLGTTPIEERIIESTAAAQGAAEEVAMLAERLGLVGQRLQRLQRLAEELLLDCVARASGKAATTAVSLGASQQVRLRFGTDGRSVAVAVQDRAGSLSRAQLLSQLTEPESSGGLSATFGAANQLLVHVSVSRFTEVTAVAHLAGSNRTALSRGCSVHLV